MIMFNEFHLNWPGFPLEHEARIILRTGEVVTYLHSFEPTRWVKGHLANPGEELFYVPLKPGDQYIVPFSNLAIHFNFTKEHLADPRGSNYTYFKDLEKLGLVSIRPGLNFTLLESSAIKTE